MTATFYVGDACDCVEGCQLADRFTPATRELMVFTKSAKRYFDLDAVREPYSQASLDRFAGNSGMKFDKAANEGRGGGWSTFTEGKLTQSGAPPLDWWQIPSPKPQPVTQYEGEPMTATFYVGDAIETMNKLPEKSVDLVLTSPPFLALRSYLPADHPDKALEGGSQATPGLFIDWLIDVVEACDRVLAPHGSLCIELGDTYAGSGGAGGDYNADGLRAGQPKFRQVPPYRVFDKRGILYDDATPAQTTPVNGGTGWPLAKSLSLIPELFRLTLVYGFNPLTGRQTERWRLRNVVRWVRPNPPVGALGDKFRPATSELMVFCKSAKRYFDLDSVRESSKTGDRVMWQSEAGDGSTDPGNTKRRRGEFQANNPAGAPPLDWWKIEGVNTLRPCEHGRYDAHWTKDGEHYAIATDRYGKLNLGPGDYEHCPGGEFLTIKASLQAPLDWWNIPLLEGEEETRYGKPPRQRKDGERSGTGPKTLNASEDGTGWAWERTLIQNPLGAPPLDWWEIPPGGYQGSHYAVFPPELCIKPIKAMCPERVCRVCGEPSRRISETEGYRDKNGVVSGAFKWESGVGKGKGAHTEKLDGSRTAVVNTVGWTSCSHDDWRPGLVLDPFGGSGTTALVATGHGRDCILIDLDERNFDLALERVGPFILERAR